MLAKRNQVGDFPQRLSSISGFSSAGKISAVPNNALEGRRRRTWNHEACGKVVIPTKSCNSSSSEETKGKSSKGTIKALMDRLLSFDESEQEDLLQILDKIYDRKV